MTSRLKVLVITYYWPPSGGAGVQRGLKFVRYFPEFGIQPIVLTVRPDQASYPVTDPTLAKDIPESVEVVTTRSFEPLQIIAAFMGKQNVPYGGFANANKESGMQKVLRWIRGNFFIPDARIGWVKYAYREAVRLIEQEQIQHIFITSPPHSSQLIGLKLKRKFPHLKWVADLRDPWTDIYYYKDLLHTRSAARKDAGMERQVLEEADVVLVVSEAIKLEFSKKSTKVQPEKIHVVPNGFDEADFPEGVVPESGYFTIAYVGTMADTYRPEVFFEAFSRLVKKYPDKKIRFQCVGNVSRAVKQQVEAYGIAANCEWISHVSHAEAIRYMQSAHLLLLIIPDTAGAEGILTGKLFEYIGAGRPILGIGPKNGDAAKILRDCRAGEMFDRVDCFIVERFLQQQCMHTQIPSLKGNARFYTRRELTRRVSKSILMVWFLLFWLYI